MSSPSSGPSSLTTRKVRLPFFEEGPDSLVEVVTFKQPDLFFPNAPELFLERGAPGTKQRPLQGAHGERCALSQGGGEGERLLFEPIFGHDPLDDAELKELGSSDPLSERKKRERASGTDELTKE